MKTDRSYFQLATVGSDTEYDYLRTSLPLFRSYIKRTVNYVQFSEKYVGRLDLFSYDVYGVVFLWWVLALANEIDDPWDESLVDNLMLIPNILDVYDFYSASYIPLGDTKVAV